MTRHIRLGLSVAAVATLAALAAPHQNGAPPAVFAQGAPAQRPATPFVLDAGEHICLIGNQLAERMQYQGWLDTLLHARFPQHDLVIRNLGFSGDEVANRLRIEELRHARTSG